MSNSNMSMVVRHQLAVMEVRHVGNLLDRVHLRNSNVCNFFISERKHKVWIVIFLVRSLRTFCLIPMLQRLCCYGGTKRPYYLCLDNIELLKNYSSYFAPNTHPLNLRQLSFERYCCFVCFDLVSLLLACLLSCQPRVPMT